MKIIVNGEEKKTQASTILELLQELNIEEKVMASALNLNVIKKDDWKTQTLKEGDRVEFLQFVGGG